METKKLTELTIDEQNHLKGGFTSVPSPDPDEGALRNKNCTEANAILNKNCGCAECTAPGGGGNDS